MGILTMEEKMEQRFSGEVDALGYRLKYVEWVKEGKDQYLRFFITRPEGIRIEDCETVSAHIGRILDEEELVAREGYILEVSSPGIEAPLRRDADYQEALGSRIRIRLYQKLDDRKEYTGMLTAFDQDTVTIGEGEASRTIERSRISRSNLVFDWDAGPLGGEKG